MKKKFVKFPNGKVWRVNEDYWAEGIVCVSEFENINSLDSQLDMISEAVTGSIVGLTDLGYAYLGIDLVKFKGFANDLLTSAAEETLEEDGYVYLEEGSPELKAALSEQYELSPVEAEHVMDTISTTCNPVAVLEECVVPVMGSFRSIHTPAHPADCSYVRIVVDGYEIAYWDKDEWKDDPSVMGAILGAAKGNQ